MAPTIKPPLFVSDHRAAEVSYVGRPPHSQVKFKFRVRMRISHVRSVEIRIQQEKMLRFCRRVESGIPRDYGTSTVAGTARVAEEVPTMP